VEPRIQYTRTSDGVNIAYYSAGEGFPVVVMPSLPVSHIEQELRIPEWRSWYERLGRDRRLVRYDARGTGLSDRGHIERDLESMVRDLEAVVDRLELERFALQCIFYAVPPAIEYAIRHPERVSHLLIFCGFARFGDLQSPQLSAIRSLIAQDWDLYTETAAHLLLGWAQGTPARSFAQFIRDSISAESVLKMVDANYDVCEQLALVQAPTLVQHRRSITWLPLDLGRDLAAGIPNSRLEVLEGGSIALYLEDSDSVLRGIDSFLADRDEGPGGANGPGLQTLLFTDLENQADILNDLGDERGRAVLREHERISRAAIRTFGGHEIKAMGDGFLASFASAQRALECAIHMQREFEKWNAGQPKPLRVRIGANAGEPISENDDVFGESVITASRLAEKAEGGEIFVANVVRELAAGKGFKFQLCSEEVLRGFDEAVRIYELQWRETAASKP
jgi:class 3 adenylate cyclase